MACELGSTHPGAVVALGKFDALHVGHRMLAQQASLMGTPWMLSFAGMAEVLGWEARWGTLTELRDYIIETFFPLKWTLEWS